MPRTEPRERVERGLYRYGDTYEAAVTPPGSRKARTKVLGQVGIMEARRLRDEFAVEVRRSPVVVSAGRSGLTARSMLADVAAAWQADLDLQLQLKAIRPRTHAFYEAALRIHVVPFFNGRVLHSIGPDDLIAWHRHQLGLTNAKGEPAAPASIYGRWVTLRGLLGYAARRGLIPANPGDLLEKREKPKPGEAVVRCLSKDEIARLMAAAPAYHADAIAIGLFLGLRIGEVLGLKWQDIDIAGGQVHVRYQVTPPGKRERLKSDAGRRDVVLMASLGKRLAARRLASPRGADDDLVIGTRLGTTVGHRNLQSRGIDKAAEDAGLADVTFHVLRHTFASILIDQGRDITYVAEQLGHSDPSFTLRRYGHLFNKARQAKATRDQLDDDFGGLFAA